MKQFICLLLFLLLQIATISSEQYCATSSSTKFTSGDESGAICAVFHGMIESRNLFYFSTQVDEYTLVGLAGSEIENGTIWDETVRMQIEVGGMQSENRTIRVTQGSSGYAVEQIGIVIVANDGVIDELVWDDGCFSCSGNDCIDDNNCGTQFTSCGSAGCDLKIYVSWYGTDADGNYLLSAGERLSQFQSNTAEEYYNAVEKEATSLVDTASSVR